MKFFLISVIVLICNINTSTAQPTSLEAAKPGESLTINGRKITVIEKDITPVVENAFSKRGTYEKADNPKLIELREQEGFDKLVAGSKDEFEQMQRIVDWAQKRLPKFGSPTSKALAPIRYYQSCR